ncbi:MAG TPA: glycosyltransferase [Novosphingobium sp.]|nr:glycosyltransferase [Novosphingobium sp.]
MRYRLLELDVARPLAPIALDPDEEGIGLFARLNCRLIGFHMEAFPAGSHVGSDELARIVDDRFALAALEARVAEEIRSPLPPRGAMPSLTVAICTKDRAARLARLLASLAEARAHSPFAETEILVIDNAPSDDSTREVVTRFEDVRHVVEAKAGLNFARNAALANAGGALLAFLDDDVVIDRDWFHGLAEAWAGAPEAGGFTGLVLPYRLDTAAQILFERHGGFGRGFARREWHATSFNYSRHPAGAGMVGAGCNMAFDVELLRSIGGFDEALDTGAPLPGGGDLDIFYRVIRTGRAVIYEPRYAVYHEHRETIAQLRHQYWTWGLGMMAFLVKVMRTDPEIRPRQKSMLRWWLIAELRRIGKEAARLRLRELRFATAEFAGGIQGLMGEYDRSRRRVDVIAGRVS